MFEAAGIKPASHIVPYCHIGQQASLESFAAKYPGYEVSLYDGSFEDWSARQEMPAAVGIVEQHRKKMGTDLPFNSSS